MKHAGILDGHPVASPLASAQENSRQGIFDRVVRHYRAQGRRCPAVGLGAYRRGRDRCFIGALIDDALYEPRMEGMSACSLLHVFDMPEWFRESADFIEELQKLHDTKSNWPAERMDMVLELFAKERGLDMVKV
jgi:hypothetical protein